MRKRRRYDLNGKVALITGAARGIGFETARALVGRGARVAITDLEAEAVERAAAEIDASGESVLALAADATDRAAMEGVVAAAIERFGRLDICIPNAGLAPPPSTVRGIDPEVFERVMEVNMMGVWRTVRAAMPHVVEARGQFVLIASVYSFFNGVYASPYACSKAGVEALGRALRVELAANDTHAALAYFGFIDTEMVRGTFDRDQRGGEFKARIPPPFNRRLAPAEAGEILAQGIERRKARIIAQGFWKPLFYWRGLFGPALDALLPHDPRMRKLTRRYEQV